jgi:hypothetical protein
MALSWSLSRLAGSSIGARSVGARAVALDAASPHLPLFPVLEVRLTEHGAVVAGPTAWDWGHCVRGASGAEDGVHARWRWDGGEVTAGVDRLGMAPLFYAAGPRSIVLSPNPLRVARRLGSPEFDDDAMAVFVRRGFFVGCDTPWKQVRAMPPGGRLSWRGGVLEVSGSIPILPASTLSYEAALDAYIEVFRAAIAARPPSDRAVMPLSGGRDSRHILLELHRQGMLPRTCLTVSRFVREPGDEVEVASGLASALGAPHETVEYPRSWAWHELEKNRRSGFCTDEHNYMMVLARAVEGRFDCAYDGIAGDVLSAPFVPPPEQRRMMEQGRYEALAREMIAPAPGTPAYGLWKPAVSEEACAWLLTPEQRGRWTLERAVARVAGELPPHAGAANPIDSFHIFNRTRREIALAPYMVARGVPTYYAPYTDRAVFDLLSSLPAPGLIGGDFHDRAIARAFPRLARTPFSIGPGVGRFRSTRAENARWLGRLGVYTGSSLPGRLARVAAYVRHYARGGPRARCGRAMVVYLNQIEAEGF